jgi:predicted extracellular nuclease
MMSKIIVLFLGVAAAELSITAYTEGSSFHKAAVVSNDGCTDVQLNDYTIAMYMNQYTGTTDVNKYQLLALPVETIASGASFTICNMFSSTQSGHDANFVAGCNYFTTDGMNGGLQHNGEDGDTIVLKKGAATIDTIGELGELTFCGSSSTKCKDQACVKTTAGAWGSSAWTCGLPKNVAPETLTGFVGSLASCPTAPTCSVHCSVSSGILQVTHDTTSAHTHHMCYKEASACVCKCCDSATSDCAITGNYEL